MTRFQKRVLAVVGSIALLLLGLSMVTFVPFILMTFVYKSHSYLVLSITDSVVLPLSFVIVSFTIGLLKR